MSHSALKQKAVSATIWSGIDLFARQGVQFLITLILARLLTPQDYGTVALLSIFVGLAAVFIQSGFSTALIQRKEITDTDLSSVFFFNIGISTLTAALLALASPWIADFYAMPVLRPLTWLLAGNLILGSLGSIQSLQLTKTLNFRPQCLISLTAQLVAGTTAVILASHEFGVWSLAVQTILSTTISTILLWVASSWRPRLIFSLTAVRSLFQFGSFLMLSALLDTLFARLNTLVIGKFHSPRDLGYYSRADQTQLLPASLISTIIGRVAFPLFSAVKDDKALLKSGLRKAVTMAMMVNLPVMLGLAATARPLVIVLFGDQWLPCVPYLQILSLSGVFWPLHVLNLNILTAQGHSNLFFRLEVIKKTLGILLLVLASSFGIVAIAWSFVVSGAISFFINAYYSGRLIDYGSLRQSLDVLPYAGAALVMLFAVWAASLLPISGTWLQMAVQVSIGGITYLLVCTVCRLSSFTEARKLIWPILTSRIRRQIDS